MLGLSTVFVIILFFGFSDGEYTDYEYSGIIHDIRDSSNGFVFYIDLDSGETIKCFFNDKPDDLGYYAIKGSYSDDNSMYFIKNIQRLDNI